MEESEFTEIIKRPILTERSMFLRDNQNKYVFEVKENANKHLIKRAVEELFKVKVKKVSTLKVKPKPKRLGRYEGRKSGWKKAIVTLKEGQSIEELLGGG